MKKITKFYFKNHCHVSHNLSFPQVKRVGNPFENEERFRTSRNDRIGPYVTLFLIGLVTFLFVAICPLSAGGETPGKVIKDITVEGLHSITNEELLYLLDLKPGGRIDLAGMTNCD